MATNKKLKTNQVTRNFQEKWEKNFFVIQQGDKAICLLPKKEMICGKKSSFQVSLIEGHFKRIHSDVLEKMQSLSSNALDEFKTNTFSKLKSQYEENLNKNRDESIIFENNLHKLASLKVSYMIAKELKYSTEGEFLKKCMLTVCKTILPDDHETFNKFDNVYLSRPTIMRNISDISENIKVNLIESLSNLQYFSICLDESNDRSDKKHLVIFIRFVNINFEIKETLLDLVQMNESSTGNAIFKQIELVFEKFKLDWRKLVAITGDGHPNIQGPDKGLIALVKKEFVKKNIQNKLFSFHCILHQENLSCKGIDLDKIIDRVDEIVKMLKRPGNFHKSFKSFLENEHAQYSDVKYFTKVRWLSRGTFLRRFLELLDDINKFLIEKNVKISELSDSLWKFKLGFLVDITTLLNILNSNLQGKNIFIIDALSQIKEFKSQLKNYISEVEQGHFFHFYNANQM